jgi:hypothetical protein
MHESRHFKINVRNNHKFREYLGIIVFVLNGREGDRSE